MKNKIYTPFGSIKSEVSLFPILYLIILYTIALFLPWKIWDNKSIFEIWTRWEHLAEHFQFIFYLSTSFICCLNIFKNKYRIFSLQNLFGLECWFFDYYCIRRNQLSYKSWWFSIFRNKK